MNDILIKKENRDKSVHTGRMPCKDERRNQGDGTEVKEYQRLPANQQKLGESHETDRTSQLSERTNSVDTSFFPISHILYYLLLSLLLLLFSGIQSNIAIRHLHISQSYNSNKPTTCPTLYIVFRTLLTIFSALYYTSP